MRVSFTARPRDPETARPIDQSTKQPSNPATTQTAHAPPPQLLAPTHPLVGRHPVRLDRSVFRGEYGERAGACGGLAPRPFDPGVDARYAEFRHPQERASDGVRNPQRPDVPRPSRAAAIVEATLGHRGNPARGLPGLDRRNSSDVRPVPNRDVARRRPRRGGRYGGPDPHPGRAGATLSSIMKRSLLAIIAIVTATSTLSGQSKQFLSPVYDIDQIYHSIEGPSSMERIFLGDPSAPAELLWVTGIRTEMVDADGKTPQLPELMCHVNVDLDPARHQAIFGFRRATASRLMTLSQGMLTAKLPAGFGFPMASTEPLLLFTQVLNLNIDHPQNLKVRHLVTIDYVRDRDAGTPIRPLFNVGASGMVQLDDNPLALQHSMMSMPSTANIATEAGHDGAATMSCLFGADAPQASAGSADYGDPLA